MATEVIYNEGHGSYNTDLIVLASAAYKTDQSIDYDNRGGSGIHVILDVTAKASSPTNIILTIQGIDPASGKAYTLLAGAAVTGVSTNHYMVYPGSAASNNVSANGMLPKRFRIIVVGTGVDTSNYFTFSVGAQLLR